MNTVTHPDVKSEPDSGDCWNVLGQKYLLGSSFPVLPLCDELYACKPFGSVWKRACNPDHVANIASGIAMAVKEHIPKVNSSSFARGNTFTVTTAIIATRKPSEVNVFDTGVL